MKTRLNLATDRFPRYRTVNLLLISALVLTLAGGAWLVSDFRLNPPDVETRSREEARLRLELEDLLRRVAEVEGRLERPDARALLAELTFLNQVMARKQFSWTLVLGEIERVIPRDVMLVGLIPEVSEEGRVFLQMEAIGRTIDDVSRFIRNLEMTASFRDVKVASDEYAILDGREEVRVVMGADYIAATMTEVGVPGD